MISISALIYKSTQFADVFYSQLHKYTPLLGTGEARFFFVANDATPEVKAHLKEKGYPHVVHDNEPLHRTSLMSRGIAKPEYISRVYKGWNRAILDGSEWVVLLNSDMFPAEGWLEGLIKHRREDLYLAGGIVERRHERCPLFPGAKHGEFGRYVAQYKEKEFQEFASNIPKGQPFIPGGAYMPCMFHRETIIRAGMYPEGNVMWPNKLDWHSVMMYGDEFLINKLKQHGVHHVTTWDSVMYHLKEGEMDHTGE